MSNSNYTITLPYNDFLKLKDKEKQLMDLKYELKECFIPDEDKRIMSVNFNGLVSIGKSLIANRYQDYNYAEVR